MFHIPHIADNSIIKLAGTFQIIHCNNGMTGYVYNAYVDDRVYGKLLVRLTAITPGLGILQYCLLWYNEKSKAHAVPIISEFR